MNNLYITLSKFLDTLNKNKRTFFLYNKYREGDLKNLHNIVQTKIQSYQIHGVTPFK